MANEEKNRQLDLFDYIKNKEVTSDQVLDQAAKIMAIDKVYDEIQSDQDFLRIRMFINRLSREVAYTTDDSIREEMLLRLEIYHAAAERYVTEHGVQAYFTGEEYGPSY